MWETGLIDAISMKVYEAMAYHVTQANFHRRVRAVGTWSLQMTASALVATLRTLMDPMATHLRELYEQGIPYETPFDIPVLSWAAGEHGPGQEQAQGVAA